MKSSKKEVAPLKAAKNRQVAGPGKKVLVFVAIAALILLVALVAFKAGKSTETQYPAGEQESEASAAEPETAAAPAASAPSASAPAASAPAAPARVTFNQGVYEEELEFTEFPTVREVQLESGMKYSVNFEFDSEIQFVVYREDMYNSWIATGTHTMSKATTKSGSSCCSKSGTFNFDINQGEGGKYFLVFDDSRLGRYDERPTLGYVRVVKTSNI